MTATTIEEVASGRRIGPLRALGHGLTLTWRSLVQVRRSPEQLLDLTLQPIFFVVLFVYLFGGAIEQDTHRYLQFVLPGILVQTIAFGSLRTGIGLNADITKGIFDRFRSLPIARSAPLVGSVLGDVVRYVVSVVIVLAFGMLLGFRVQTGPLETLAACALVLVFALGLCWISAAIGLVVRSPGTVQGLGAMVMFALTFGSNLFVQTSTLPGWLQAWVRINPVTQVVTATRGLLLGGAVAGPVLASLLWTAGITIVFAPLAIMLYRRRA
jgi:oleandomycin transport system permease protein